MLAVPPSAPVSQLEKTLCGGVAMLTIYKVDLESPTAQHGAHEVHTLCVVSISSLHFSVVLSSYTYIILSLPFTHEYTDVYEPTSL